jgi:hypothetical protein
MTKMKEMNGIPVHLPLSLTLVLALVPLGGCGSSSLSTPAALSANNLNLIFVASEDLNYQAAGDINPSTANFTSQGLQRSLLMGTFLHEQVLGGSNVTSIYALEPMTHLQTENNYPDMVALETIQQFAMLNQISLTNGNNPLYTGNSFPIHASYASGSLPAGVAFPVLPCTACQGLDFNDQNGDNEALVGSVVQANAPGFYLFSAPWETVSALMASINRLEGYNLTLPSIYAGPNYVYTISITPKGEARLATYDGELNPPSTYPVLPPSPLVSAACTEQAPFHVQLTVGSGGSQLPAGGNTNETVYFIRHAEAHPTSYWDDSNYIGAGQWRALDLANALRGKIHPTQVVSYDPSIGVPLGLSDVSASSVGVPLTVEPYAIANNLPYTLAASVPVLAQNPPHLATATSDYFFTGQTFSNQAILVAWDHEHLPTIVSALLASYQSGLTAPSWPDEDYDTIWTVTIDAQGNLTVDNGTCEGIDSAALPATPPQF